MKSFSKNGILKNYMEVNGITAQELADKLYIPVEAVESWTSGSDSIGPICWFNITREYPDLNQALEAAVRTEIDRRRQRR